jgi:hypothetical protein
MAHKIFHGILNRPLSIWWRIEINAIVFHD